MNNPQCAISGPGSAWFWPGSDTLWHGYREPTRGHLEKMSHPCVTRAGRAGQSCPWQHVRGRKSRIGGTGWGGLHQESMRCGRIRTNRYELLWRNITLIAQCHRLHTSQVSDVFGLHRCVAAYLLIDTSFLCLLVNTQRHTCANRIHHSLGWCEACAQCKTAVSSVR